MTLIIGGFSIIKDRVPTIEGMNSKFELVLEGHQVLRQDIRRLGKTLSEKIEENTARIKINSDESRSWMKNSTIVLMRLMKS